MLQRCGGMSMTSMHRLDINGMSCGACVASVERLAMGVEGVESVSVNLALERAVVALQHAAHRALVGGWLSGAEGCCRCCCCR